MRRNHPHLVLGWFLLLSPLSKRLAGDGKASRLRGPRSGIELSCHGANLGPASAQALGGGSREKKGAALGQRPARLAGERISSGAGGGGVPLLHFEVVLVWYQPLSEKSGWRPPLCYVWSIRSTRLQEYHSERMACSIRASVQPPWNSSRGVQTSWRINTGKKVSRRAIGRRARPAHRS